MRKKVVLITCVLATLALGLSALWLPAAHSCAVASCCCSEELTTPDPCVCNDGSESELPEMAAAAGMTKLASPPAEILPVRGQAALAELPPTWQPALPWHAPPQEVRRRLAVWIL
ncbi:MAG: hypothetical protein ACRDBP_17620 [Luteolibacter sp.]